VELFYFVQQMILIYSNIPSPRLQYSCSFIFKELLGLDCRTTIDSEEFKNYEGVCINYSATAIKEKEFRITNYELLFEISIKEQPISCFEINRFKAFFKTTDCDYGFDIFAATFYLLSRYEEYLDHTKDMYGRYAHENSLAFKEGFLQLPLINIWAKDFIAAVKKKFPSPDYSYKAQYSIFRFKPTYDIDIAYSYKHKGFVRNIGGFLKFPSAERLKVLLGWQKDPFDSFTWLHELHQQHKLQATYFFLMAEKNGQYDKNILPHKDVMWQLIKRHAKKYAVGIHPSWQSGDTPDLLMKEKEYLAEIVEKDIIASRQHYIRFNLPEGYQQLIDAGITDDYSMGYGSINGFRASVASSFFWYDLQKDKQTSLRIHPFCFMEANSFYEQHFSAAQAYDELMHYLTICKAVNGTLITIWHNNFLGTAKGLEDWREMYERFIGVVSGEE
jgi:hypothetical protein